ncbi:13286_t:CDS:2 [Funneliformis mosseae]|uniref:13286_t:CDS:1 n=1 Tax=Funneliformis mosseae TaxID=27381 RepID=A0A9N9CX41_FUNMO|nr:13286_t:CDS:2 [Funneliformis mosseae]
MSHDSTNSSRQTSTPRTLNTPKQFLKRYAEAQSRLAAKKQKLLEEGVIKKYNTLRKPSTYLLGQNILLELYQRPI